MNANIPTSNGLDTGSQCIGNIGPKEQRRRFRFGMAAIAFGVVCAAAMIGTGLDRLWRLGLFLPFYMGAVGYFQARAQT